MHVRNPQHRLARQLHGAFMTHPIAWKSGSLASGNRPHGWRLSHRQQPYSGGRGAGHPHTAAAAVGPQFSPGAARQLEWTGLRTTRYAGARAAGSPSHPGRPDHYAPVDQGSWTRSRCLCQSILCPQNGVNKHAVQDRDRAHERQAEGAPHEPARYGCSHRQTWGPATDGRRLSCAHAGCIAELRSQ